MWCFQCLNAKLCSLVYDPPMETCMYTDFLKNTSVWNMVSSLMPNEAIPNAQKHNSFAIEPNPNIMYVGI